MGVVVERGGGGGGRMFAARQKFRNGPLNSRIQKRIGSPLLVCAVALLSSLSFGTKLYQYRCTVLIHNLFVSNFRNEFSAHGRYKGVKEQNALYRRKYKIPENTKNQSSPPDQFLVFASSYNSSLAVPAEMSIISLTESGSTVHRTI